jgi:hypothetical protein
MLLRSSFLLLAVAVVVAPGCKKKPPPGPATGPSAKASALASAVPVPSASVAEVADAALDDAAAPSERAVAAGNTPTGFHVGAFNLKALVESPGLGFGKAVEACALAGKFLCSEFEWQRACADAPELGKTETWTYSAERDRAVVRGGDTCEKRALVNPSDASGARATLCCDRAVGMIGGFGDAAEKIGAGLVVYERGLRENKAEDVTAVTLETLVFAGKELKREELLPAALQALLPDASKEPVLFDSCLLKPEDAGQGTNLELGRSPARKRPRRASLEARDDRTRAPAEPHRSAPAAVAWRAKAASRWFSPVATLRRATVGRRFSPAATLR